MMKMMRISMMFKTVLFDEKLPCIDGDVALFILWRYPIRWIR